MTILPVNFRQPLSSTKVNELIDAINANTTALANTVAFLRAVLNGKKFDAGTFSITTTAANTAQATLTFPTPFATPPFIDVTPESTGLVAARVQSRTTTSVIIAIWLTNGGNFSAGAQTVNWMALG